MSSTSPVPIAGLHSGIRVNIKSDLHETYQRMELLAQHNHWARLVVQHINSLSSGQFKKNVYVKDTGRLADFCEYSIVLPGCTATFHKTQSGEFNILTFEPSEDYQKQQEDGKKPGLFRAKKANTGWAASLLPNGEITDAIGNTVIVSDQYTSVDNALDYGSSAASASGLTSSADLELQGFDLHFTPGKNRIGGFRNSVQARNAATDPDLHESAILLAYSMKNSTNIKGVKWVSEGGGSGVLTQAMQILKNQNVSFANAGHHIFFEGVRTNIATAEQLARDIGLPLKRYAHSKNLLNINQLAGSGLMGGVITSYQKFRQEKKHTALKFGMDMFKEFGEHTSALGTVGLTGSVIGTAAMSAVTSVGIGAGVTAAITLSASALALPASIAFCMAAGPKVISALDKVAVANSKKYKDIKARYL